MSRSADLAWCALSAPILFPLFGLIALAIWLEDGRPVFFRQRRLGRGRRIFTILKFRTMSHGMSHGTNHGTSHGERGGRRTRVGAWLRRTGLDETAQWLNVLRGDMSWIGPRPLTEADVARLGWDRPRHDARYRIKPGMTGLAQLFAGTSSAWTRGVDRIYRRRRGPALDAWIIIWSVICCVLGKSRGRRLLRAGKSRRMMPERRQAEKLYAG